MRILLKVTLPHEKFNETLRKGTNAQTMNRILEETRPEAAYFTEMDGKRTAILIVNLDNASKMPSVAEPWFLQFGADVEFHPAMSAEDLKNSGLEAISKKWA